MLESAETDDDDDDDDDTRPRRMIHTLIASYERILIYFYFVLFCFGLYK
jgi:hypothetical protein